MKKIENRGALKLTPEELDIVPCLPKDLQVVIKKLYFNQQSIQEIADEEGLSYNTISQKRRDALKIIEKQLCQHEGTTYKTKNIDPRTIKTKQTLREKLKKYQALLDFENEVYPNISPEYIYIVDNFIQQDDTSATEINRDLLRCSTYTSNMSLNLFAHLDKILLKKELIKNLYDQFGGAEELEDLAYALSPRQRQILQEKILRLSFNGDLNFEKVVTRLNEIHKNKIETENFIEKNGGVEFLLYDFAPLLHPTQQKVLTKIMMDYHYPSKSVVAKEIGISKSLAKICVQKIEKKLEITLLRKSAIEKVINKIGVENLYSFSCTLTAKEYDLLFNYILNPIPVKIQHVLKALDCSQHWFERALKRITSSLQSLQGEQDN